MSAGHGARSDARKRLEVQHQAHPDPAVCELIARAWDEGCGAGYIHGYEYAQDTYDGDGEGPANPYRSAS